MGTLEQKLRSKVPLIFGSWVNQPLAESCGLHNMSVEKGVGLVEGNNSPTQLEEVISRSVSC